MSNAGSALMGIGSSRGEERAVAAAEMAISSPLLEASIDGAQGVLLSIQGGSDLGLFEINEAANLVAQSAHPEANIIFGAVIDDALGDEVRVTVIASGFDSPARIQRELGEVVRAEPEPTNTDTGPLPAATVENSSASAGDGIRAGSPAGSDTRSDREPMPVGASTGPVSLGSSPYQRNVEPPNGSRRMFDDPNDDLDVPDFLK
jgi:cell division protein FtsZ